MAKKEFQRHGNGLVDLECYLPYLPDPSGRVPIDPPKYDGCDWVRQHVLFQRVVWNEFTHPKLGVRPNSYNYRNHWANQVIMRNKKEKKLHLDFVDTVEPPDVAIINAAILELDHLDNLGAAIVGQEVVRDPVKMKALLPKNDGPRYGHEMTGEERIRLFDSHVQEALEALGSLTVTDQRIVTSALARMAKLFNLNGIVHPLEPTVEERLSKDHVYYPLHTPSIRSLYTVSNVMLRDVCKVVEVDARVAQEELADAA